jgi:adenosylmethionine-8-amino-7-oxononanoate aminotransferase
MKKANESDEAFVQRLAQQFENEILRVGPNRVAGFIAETVSGTTLGCLPAVPGYFKAIREICDKYEVLLILDEVRVYFPFLVHCVRDNLNNLEADLR